MEINNSDPPHFPTAARAHTYVYMYAHFHVPPKGKIHHKFEFF